MEIDPFVFSLKKLCSQNGGVKSVADKAKVSDGNLSQIVNGTLLPSGNPRGVGPRLRKELSKAFPHWLDLELQPINGELSKHVSNVEPGPDIRGKLPLISKIQAGEWDTAFDNFAPGDADRWMACSVRHSPSSYVLRVTGDSMTAPNGSGRSYPPGCYVFVDPELRSPCNGDRIIAKLACEGEDCVTFKIYKNEDGRQWLQPLNPSHEPIREEFTVLGKVIGKWEDE